MNVSEEYHRFVMQKLAPLDSVTSRKMFGGYGIFHDSLMFALISADTLYFKVSETNREMYEKAGSSVFPHGISYWEVPSEVLEEDGRLHEWAHISIDIAHQNATKKSGGKKRRG